MLKLTSTILLLAVLTGASTARAQAPQVRFSSVTMEKDAVLYGTKGITIAGKFDITEYRKVYTNDSLMYRAFAAHLFYLTIKPLSGSLPIQPAKGYEYNFSKHEVAEKIQYKPNKDQVDSCIFTFEWFLPYAALNLKSGDQSLSISLEFYGKDGFNNIVSGQYTRDHLSFSKPKIRLFELALDSIVINPVNEKGTRWDPSFMGRDLADLDFSLAIGGLRVYSIYQENTNNIYYRKAPFVYTFAISENDEIYVTLVDKDLYFNDKIAGWKFNSSEMKVDVSYQQTGSKTNLAAFHFICKAGPLLE